MSALQRELMFQQLPRTVLAELCPPPTSVPPSASDDPSVEAMDRSPPLYHRIGKGGSAKMRLLLQPLPRKDIRQNFVHSVKRTSPQKVDRATPVIEGVPRSLPVQEGLSLFVANTEEDESYRRSRSIVRDNTKLFDSGFVKRCVPPRVTPEDFGALRYIFSMSHKGLHARANLDVRHYDLGWLQKDCDTVLQDMTWTTVQDPPGTILNSPRSVWLFLHNGLAPAMLLYGGDNMGPEGGGPVPHPTMVAERRRFEKERQHVECIEIRRQYSEMCSQITREDIVRCVCEKMHRATHSEKIAEDLEVAVQKKFEIEQQKLGKKTANEIEVRKRMWQKVKEREVHYMKKSFTRTKQLQERLVGIHENSHSVEKRKERTEKLAEVRVEMQSHQEAITEEQKKVKDRMIDQRLLAVEQRRIQKQKCFEQKQQQRFQRVAQNNEALAQQQREVQEEVEDRLKKGDECLARHLELRQKIHEAHMETSEINRQHRKEIIEKKERAMQTRRDELLGIQVQTELRFQELQNNKKVIVALRQHNALLKEYDQAKHAVQRMQWNRETERQKEALAKSRELIYGNLKHDMDTQSKHSRELSHQREMDKYAHKVRQANKDEFSKLKLIDDKTVSTPNLKQIAETLAQATHNERAALSVKRRIRMKQLEQERTELMKETYLQLVELD